MRMALHCNDWWKVELKVSFRFLIPSKFGASVTVKQSGLSSCWVPTRVSPFDCLTWSKQFRHVRASLFAKIVKVFLPFDAGEAKCEGGNDESELGLTAFTFMMLFI